MRYKDQNLMKRIKEYAEAFYFEKGRTPSTTEIAQEVGITRGSVYRYLVEMGERGMVCYQGGKLFTDKMSRVSPITGATVYEGAIPCGPQDVIEASVEEYVKLPTSIFGDGELYIIRTTGDSMQKAGIEPGDLVVVRKQEEAEVGDIVVALTDEHQNTLKRLEYDEDRKCYYLHPENDHYDDIYVDSLQIQGVACHVIRKL